MTDKIKLKADKFVNDKKLKLNYIKTKDLKILLAEFCEEQMAELEKENLRVKRACHKWFMRWREAKKDALYFDSSLQKQIEATLKLQQENSELKGLVNQYKASKCSGISLVNRNMIMSDQLTKAKELLKEFVHHYKAKTIYIENIQDLLEQAEQFLSEVEK